MRSEALNQFHCHARFTIDFRYEPSQEETNYVQLYSSLKDAFIYMPDIALARYVMMSNVAAQYTSSTIFDLWWFPRISERTYYNHHLALSFLTPNLPAIR